MQQERLYISVGVFVLGAIILAVAGGIFIYNQYLQAKTETYVMFFKGSLNGLDATSAVTYRGVKVGEVRRIELTTTKSKTNVSIPVYVQFFVEKSFVPGESPIQVLINKGVVARIASPNILTGTASIELIPTESKQASITSRTFHGYLLFPTETNEDEESNFADTLKTARKTLNDISKFVRSQEIKETLLTIQMMAQSIDKFALLMSDQVPNAVIYFNDSLKDIARMSYSVSNLADYLTRHPEALLRGR